MTSIPAILGYVVAASVATWIATRYLQPRVKLEYRHYSAPSFWTDNLQNTIGIGRTFVTNSGRKTAKNVEVRLSRPATHIRIHPELPTENHITESKEHSIQFQSIGAGETVDIQYMGLNGEPWVKWVRSDTGPAKQVPVELKRSYPDWVGATVLVLLLLGTGTAIYLLSWVGIHFYNFVGF